MRFVTVRRKVSSNMVLFKHLLVIGTLLLRGVLSCEFEDDFDFGGEYTIHDPAAIKMILEHINDFRSKFASGELSKSASWAKDVKLVANMHEVFWNRVASLPSRYVNSSVPNLTLAKCMGSAASRNSRGATTLYIEGGFLALDPQKVVDAVISGDIFKNIFNPPGEFGSIEELCLNATTLNLSVTNEPTYDRYNSRGEFLCLSLNPLLVSIGCFVAKYRENKIWNYYLTCRFCVSTNKPTVWSNAENSIQSGVPCSGCYEERCSNNYFGLCSTNSSYEPVSMKLTSLVYINKTYPTIPQRQTRIRRNRHLVRKVVQQRILWADVYGPDFVPNPLFMLYKTTKSKSTATVIPLPPSNFEIDVPGQQPQPHPQPQPQPQPSELPKLEEPKSSLEKPLRKHNPIGHKDHPLINYWQPDYSSGLISLGTEEEYKDCLKKFRMFQKCGSGTAERVHLNYLLAFVCALFVFLF